MCEARHRGKKNLKLTWKHKRPQIAKVILSKSNIWFRILLQSHSDTNSPMLARAQTWTNGIEYQAEIKPHSHVYLKLSKDPQSMHRRKDSFCSSGAGKIGSSAENPTQDEPNAAVLNSMISKANTGGILQDTGIGFLHRTWVAEELIAKIDGYMRLETHITKQTISLHSTRLLCISLVSTSFFRFTLTTHSFCFI